MFAQERLDLLAVALPRLGKDQVLVRREPELALVVLRRSSADQYASAIGHVLNAAILDEQGEEPVALPVLDPAVAVAGVGEPDRRRVPSG